MRNALVIIVVPPDSEKLNQKSNLGRQAGHPSPTWVLFLEQHDLTWNMTQCSAAPQIGRNGCVVSTSLFHVPAKPIQHWPGFPLAAYKNLDEATLVA